MSVLQNRITDNFVSRMDTCHTVSNVQVPKSSASSRSRYTEKNVLIIIVDTIQIRKTYNAQHLAIDGVR